MKGFLMYIALVVMLILVRISLNDDQQNENTTTLDLWTFQAAHQDFYKEMEHQWNVENPDNKITLNVSVLPSEDMHNKLLVCSTSSSGCPDIADIEVKRFPLFLKGDTPPLYDLTSYVSPYLDNVVSSRFGMYSKDGVNYGIPSHVGAEVMYYNEEILEKANVDSSGIQTWKDYIDAGYKVKEATGKPMTVIETSENLIVWPILIQYGADYFMDNDQLDIDNQKAEDIYKQIQVLLEDGVIEIAPGGKVHSEDFYGYMNSGNVASLPMPIWYMNRFTDYMPDLSGKISIQKYPINPNNPEIATVGIGGTGTVVMNNSENKEVAAEFITFAKLSKIGSETAWNILGFDPVNTNTWEELINPPKFDNYFTTNPLEVLNMYDPQQIISPKMNSSLTEVTKELSTNFYFDIFEQQKNVEECLKNEVAVLKK